MIEKTYRGIRHLYIHSIAGIYDKPTKLFKLRVVVSWSEVAALITRTYVEYINDKSICESAKYTQDADRRASLLNPTPSFRYRRATQYRRPKKSFSDYALQSGEHIV